MKIECMLGIATSLCVVVGCVAGSAGKYVGAWCGTSVKDKDGAMVKLDDGGDGYAMTAIGAVPLKWKVTDVNRLDVRFSCGDGTLCIYDMSYSPKDRTLRLLHEKSICFRDGRVSNERSFDDMTLCCSNEYAKAMAPAIEYAEKFKDFHANSERSRNQDSPETVTNHMEFASWDEVGQLCKPLQEGWSVGLFSAGHPKLGVSILPEGRQGQIKIAMPGGRFVIGNPDDKCDYEIARHHGVWLPVETVPSNATLIPGSSWDAAIESDMLRKIRDRGWTLERVAYYDEHFFYAIFAARHAVQVGDASADDVVRSLADCFGQALKPPLNAILWKGKGQVVEQR